jgi:hypothetical protein
VIVPKGMLGVREHFAIAGAVGQDQRAVKSSACTLEVSL